MNSNLNRRNWLKAGSLLAGSMAFGSLPTLQAKPQRMMASRLEGDLGEFQDEMPPLRARLLANENPFGPSEKAKEALIEAINMSYRYPMKAIGEFKSMIAKAEGVKPENVTLAAGSTEILLAGALAYGQGKSKILSADITYMDLLQVAQDHGAEWDQVPLTKELDFDLPAMASKLSRDHSLVYLVNPNNPVGKSLDAGALKSFCNEVADKKPVFIDEAYIDFKDDVEKNSMISCVREGKNVIVTRTFSKLHAFAGLRIGYAIALPETINLLESFSSGGRTISSPSLYAAMASYTDEEFKVYSKAKIIESKQFLYQTLTDSGYEYVASDANFVLFPLKYMTADRFQKEMFKQQVGIRKWSFRDTEWCRVSIGTMEEMKIFAAAFEKLA